MVPADLRGCGFYRLWLPFKHLHDLGKYRVKFTQLIRESDIVEADVVVFQRCYFDQIGFFTKLAHKVNTVVMSDVDDNLFDIPSYNLHASVFAKGSKNMQNLATLWTSCDSMITTTENLKQVYSKFCPSIYVCENSFDDKWIRPLEDADLNRVVWAGGAFHGGDFEVCKKEFRRFFKDNPELIFVCVGWDSRHELLGEISSRTLHITQTLDDGDRWLKDRYFERGMFRVFPDSTDVVWEWDGWGKEKHYAVGRNSNMIGMGNAYDRVEIPDLAWDTDRYYENLRQSRAGFGLAPLEDNKLNAGKGWGRLFEYLMNGIPYVASNLYEYKRFHTLNSGGLIADPKHWYENLTAIYKDQELRKELLEEGIKCLKQFSIQKTFSKWEQAIEETVERKQRVLSA